MLRRRRLAEGWRNKGFFLWKAENLQATTVGEWWKRLYIDYRVYRQPGNFMIFHVFFNWKDGDISGYITDKWLVDWFDSVFADYPWAGNLEDSTLLKNGNWIIGLGMFDWDVTREDGRWEFVVSCARCFSGQRVASIFAGNLPIYIVIWTKFPELDIKQCIITLWLWLT